MLLQGYSSSYKSTRFEERGNIVGKLPWVRTGLIHAHNVQFFLCFPGLEGRPITKSWITMRSHHGTQERTKHFVTRVTFVLMDCVLTACGSCICMQAANAYLKLLKCNSRFFDICQIFSRRPDSSLVSRHVIHFRVEMGYNFSDWNWLIFTLVIYQY